MEDLKYPLGKYQPVARVDQAQRNDWIKQLSTLPAELSAAVEGLNERELDTPYRQGGWTVRQVVHHVADSHMNSYVRFRLALTEDVPTIKAYEEALWAELPDARTLPVSLSLNILTGLHVRWTALLEALTEPDFKRTLRHPVSGEMSLEYMLGLYAWHGQHHTAQILRMPRG